jgi:hypothetical protein
MVFRAISHVVVQWEKWTLTLNFAFSKSRWMEGSVRGAAQGFADLLFGD